MSGNVLDRLLTDELLANAGAFSTAAALRQFFARAQEVQEVRTALQQGTLTEDAINDFVTTLLEEQRRGVLFRHDLTMAALAVALEGQTSSFVEEFLRNFADVSIAEMPMGPRVAKEVLKQQCRLVANQANGAVSPAQHGQSVTQPETDGS